MRLPWLSVRIHRTQGHCRARLCRCGGRASAFCILLSWASTSLSSRFLSQNLVAKLGRGMLRPYKPLRYCDSFAFLLNLRGALGHIFALIDPALHADDAVRGVGFGSTEIDVRAEGLQGQTALQIPFFAGNFRAVQAAGNANLDAFAAKAQRRVNGFAHGAAESYALFELERNRF